MSSESILSFMILWLPPASQIERKWDIWPNYNHFLSFSSLFLYALIFLIFVLLKHYELLLLLMCFYLDKILLSKFNPQQVFEIVFMYVFAPAFSLWENYADLCICSIFLFWVSLSRGSSRVRRHWRWEVWAASGRIPLLLFQSLFAQNLELYLCIFTSVFFQWHILCPFPLVEYFHKGIDGAGKFGRPVREFLGREILCCGARETQKRWRSQSASICRGPIRSEGGPATSS